MNISKSKESGFTFFELVVVIAIIGILSAIVITGYREFERDTVLGNLAQDVALSVRLAQSYGLNVRSEGGVFERSYGVYFDASDRTNYEIFRDENRGVGGFVNTGDTEEVFQFGTGYTIANVCALDASNGDNNCFEVGGDNIITEIHIVFDRPKPDANFRDNNGYTDYQSATITIRDIDGKTRDIGILATGYISVQ